MEQFDFLVSLVKPDLYWLQYWNNNSSMFFPFFYWKHGNYYWFKYYQYKKSVRVGKLTFVDKFQTVHSFKNNNCLIKSDKLHQIDFLNDSNLQKIAIDLKRDIVHNTYKKNKFTQSLQSINLNKLNEQLLDKVENFILFKLSSLLSNNETISLKDYQELDLLLNKNFWAEVIYSECIETYYAALLKNIKEINHIKSLYVSKNLLLNCMLIENKNLVGLPSKPISKIQAGVFNKLITNLGNQKLKYTQPLDDIISDYQANNFASKINQRLKSTNVLLASKPDKSVFATVIQSSFEKILGEINTYSMTSVDFQDLKRIISYKDKILKTEQINGHLLMNQFINNLNAKPVLNTEIFNLSHFSLFNFLDFLETMVLNIENNNLQTLTPTKNVFENNLSLELLHNSKNFNIANKKIFSENFNNIYSEGYQLSKNKFQILSHQVSGDIESIIPVLIQEGSAAILQDLTYYLRKSENNINIFSILELYLDNLIKLHSFSNTMLKRETTDIITNHISKVELLLKELNQFQNIDSFNKNIIDLSMFDTLDLELNHKKITADYLTTLELTIAKIITNMQEFSLENEIQNLDIARKTLVENLKQVNINSSQTFSVSQTDNEILSYNNFWTNTDSSAIITSLLKQITSKNTKQTTKTHSLSLSKGSSEVVIKMLSHIYFEFYLFNYINNNEYNKISSNLNKLQIEELSNYCRRYIYQTVEQLLQQIDRKQFINFTKAFTYANNNNINRFLNFNFQQFENKLTINQFFNIISSYSILNPNNYYFIDSDSQNVFKNKLFKTTRNLDLFKDRLSKLFEDKDLNGDRLSKLFKDKDLNGNELFKLFKDKDLNGNKLSKLFKDKDLNGNKLSRLFKDKDLNSNQLSKLFKDKDLNNNQLSKLSRDKDLNNNRLSKLFKDKDLNSNQLSKLFTDKNLNSNQLSKLIVDKDLNENKLSKLFKNKDLNSNQLSKLFTDKNLNSNQLSKLFEDKDLNSNQLSKLFTDKDLNNNNQLSKLFTDKDLNENRLSKFTVKAPKQLKYLANLYSLESLKFLIKTKQLASITQEYKLFSDSNIKTAQQNYQMEFYQNIFNVKKYRDIYQENFNWSTRKPLNLAQSFLNKIEQSSLKIEQINKIFALSNKHNDLIQLYSLHLNQDKNLKIFGLHPEIVHSHIMHTLNTAKKINHHYTAINNIQTVIEHSRRIKKILNNFNLIEILLKNSSQSVNTVFTITKLTEVEQQFYQQNHYLKSISQGDSDYKTFGYLSEIMKTNKNQNFITGNLQMNPTASNIYISDSIRDQYREKNISTDDSIHDTQRFKALEKIESENHWLTWEQRWWFLKALEPSDYKILPKDIVYPLDFTIINEPFPDKRVVELEQEFFQTGRFELKIFDKDYNRLLTLDENIFHDVTYNENNIQVNIDYLFNPNGFTLKWSITDYSGLMNHIFLSHPKDQYGKTSTYALTQDFYDKKHPIPFGQDMGLSEIPIPINIMVDFLNILLMIWTKLFHAYTGFTGYRAVANLVTIIHDWLILGSSQENESIKYYERCYRWLRWEAESVLQECKTEPHLRGNYWVEKLIYELIDYMESHHIDYLPVWEDLIKMDEQRNIFNDPTLDMEITLNKVKGIRHKVIENNRR